MIERIAVERFRIQSSKSFEEVLLGLEAGTGRPRMSVLQPQLDAASSFPEFQVLIETAVGRTKVRSVHAYTSSRR